jgi:RNA polymerase sigma factor (sigma-70 family)
VTAELDRERFEGLYAEHRQSVLAYLLRRTDAADAADLLAETFLVAWRRIDVVPDGEPARLWLFGVARNTLRNHRRATRAGEALAAALQDALASVTQSTPDNALAVSVRAALDRLNPPDREVLMLTVYEELTPAEIAEVTGRSSASVRVRLHRARRRLAEALDDSKAAASLVPAAASAARG